MCLGFYSIFLSWGSISRSSLCQIKRWNHIYIWYKKDRWKQAEKKVCDLRAKQSGVLGRLVFILKSHVYLQSKDGERMRIWAAPFAPAVFSPPTLFNHCPFQFNLTGGRIGTKRQWRKLDRVFLFPGKSVSLFYKSGCCGCLGSFCT